MMLKPGSRTITMSQSAPPPIRDNAVWPEIPQTAWYETCATIQLWAQMVGKIRLELTPPINHTWNVTLYPTVRGLTTSPMPHGTRTLQIDFDFLDHLLVLQTSDGGYRVIPLKSIPVADFYRQLMAALDDLDTPVHILTTPCEIAQPIPFEQDHQPRVFDWECALIFWRILLQTTRVFTSFRARFTGKVSPIHLFWGALDLACTRFSGRSAPEHPSMPGLPDRVTRDAYSHEVSSCGFWPGAPGIAPFFYSYAYPEPPGYKESPILPAQARFDSNLGEFVLAYDDVRMSPDPDSALLQFLQSTYEAAADCARWDRASLEVAPRPPSP